MTKRIFVALIAATSLLNADTLVLRDGTRIEGRLLGSDGQSVRFMDAKNQANTYYRDQIDSIRLTTEAPNAEQGGAYPPPNSSPQPTNYPPPNPTYPAGSVQGPTAQYSENPTPNGAPAGFEVPAGTQIVVRLIDAADSQKDLLGQTYRATVDQPVAINGQTAIPRGADAIVVLTDAQQSGKITGRTVLTLSLRNITVNGRAYDIATSNVAEASGSRGKRSGEVIGGAAALGAIIGGIAGGGKGAAIGAGSGAAVGTAGQVLTSGQKVKVPAETRLTFTLQNPIDL